jgi:NTP pyrophosphatase (non-canonical NTP hydrolase)
MDRQQIYRQILSQFGNTMQSIVAIEEMSELQKALAKYLRGLQYHDYGDVLANIREEIADVQIMLDQLKLVFDSDNTVEQIIDDKLQRTVDRYLK